VYDVVKEFWIQSYRTDRTAFYYELISLIFTVAGSVMLTLTSPHPQMHFVFPFYLIGSTTMAYSAYRRRNLWITMLASWFTLMNCIGNYLVFFK